MLFVCVGCARVQCLSVSTRDWVAVRVWSELAVRLEQLSPPPLLPSSVSAVDPVAGAVQASVIYSLAYTQSILTSLCAPHHRLHNDWLQPRMRKWFEVQSTSVEVSHCKLSFYGIHANIRHARNPLIPSLPARLLCPQHHSPSPPGHAPPSDRTCPAATAACSARSSGTRGRGSGRRGDR